MKESKPMKTPLDGNNKLSIEDALKTNEEINEMRNVPYQSLIGALIYLVVSTRPDIAYTISVLSQFNVNPGRMHWVAAKRVLRYLRSTSDHGLTFKKTQEKLIGFVDADWASDIDGSFSHTGVVFKLADAVVTWEAQERAEPTIVYCDNQGAQKLMRNPIYHSRSKHIDIKYHYVREVYKNGDIDVKFLASSNMIADVFTKELFEPSHKKCIEGF
ncbi:secreted RxLR effector protein 161-like [Leptopilina heterotoma]|uniref:secreted RxLR effector protein 161-like n=1 Tax=Leptopilina heterotoma TaxID=63436 RepID=UPI001CA80127|nr:secreted RxLR effector protein 161-like [Leptopilina heterotoma]